MRRIFALLVRGAALLLASACAHAVYLASDGLGQALIYPYYSAQQTLDGADFITLFSVTNTRAEGKVLRLRLREGRGGREVFAFNLYLAPNDVWTGAVVRSFRDASATLLLTNDVSCTNPTIPVSGVTLGAPGLDPSQALEGYIEVIEMAAITGASLESATHSTFTGVPSCNGLTGPTVLLQTAPPTGGLMGTLTVINVVSGLDFTVNADALAQLSTRSFYRDIGDPYPDFNAAEVDPVSLVEVAGKTWRMTWASGLDAVQSTLMRRTVENEVILDTATRSATDWVVTFPTKRFFDPANPRPPFDQVAIPAGREIHFITRFRPRDGAEVALMEFCETLCPPGWYQGYNLRMPWAASVVSFKPQTPALEIGSATVSTALGSRNAWLVPLSTGSASGAASLGPEGMGALGSMTPLSAVSMRHSNGTTVNEPVTITGFPMVGFMVRTFNNGRLTCGAGACQGNYGGSFPHKWTTGIR